MLLHAPSILLSCLSLLFVLVCFVVLVWFFFVSCLVSSYLERFADFSSCYDNILCHCYWCLYTGPSTTLKSFMVSMWQHGDCWFKNVLFTLYHLVCKELNLYRCYVNENWVWICCKLSLIVMGSLKGQMFKMQVWKVVCSSCLPKPARADYLHRDGSSCW